MWECAIYSPISQAQVTTWICNWHLKEREAGNVVALSLFIFCWPEGKWDLVPWPAISGGSVVKNPPVSAGDMGLIPGLGDPLEEGTGNPLQYSCLGNPRDRGVWHATVRGVSKNQTWLSTHTCTEFYTKLSVSGTLSGSLFNSFEHLFSSFVFSGQWYDSDCYLSTCSPVISPELYIYKLIYYKHLPTQHLSLFKYRVVTSDWLVITEMEPFMHSMQLAPSVSPSSQQPKLQDWNLRAL